MILNTKTKIEIIMNKNTFA